MPPPPHSPMQEPHRSLEGRQSAACQKFASHVPECWREKKKKWTESNSDMCTRRRFHPGVCFATVRSCQRFSCDFNCVIFDSGSPLLPTRALAWSFGWCQEIPFSILSLKGRSTRGLGARQGLLFMCFCLSIKKMGRVGEWWGKEGEWHTRFAPAGWCVSYICIWVCVRRGSGSVRDSDGAERVWCTVITLSGMWLSWELLAPGTWENELLFKGKLPSLYRLLALPP